MEKMLTIRDKGSTYLILISTNGDILSFGNLNARYILAEKKRVQQGNLREDNEREFNFDLHCFSSTLFWLWVKLI